MDHEIKVTPPVYARVKSGEMTFQVLDNQPGYQAGDKITLREWDSEQIQKSDPAQKGFTDSPQLTFLIGYVLVLSKSEVVISLLPIKKGR